MPPVWDNANDIKKSLGNFLSNPFRLFPFIYYRLLGPSIRKLRKKLFKVEFFISKLLYKLLYQGRKAEVVYDLVLILPEDGRGWILEAIGKEIANYFEGKTHFHYSTLDVPPAKAYYCCHYSFLPTVLKRNPQVWGSKALAFYTHPRELSTSDAELIYTFNQIHQLVCMCSSLVTRLQGQGVASDHLTYAVGGVDLAIFQPHDRGGGCVGFCTAYYERKSPERVFEIVKQMPHRRFLLLGRKWEQYDKFAEMQALPNFTYVEAPYADYPTYYAQMDVFVSPAKLEGGPIPLLEAMAANAVPVASRTGFAPDVIEHGKNGFIFDVDSPVEAVCDLIESAYQLDGDIRSTVEQFSWQQFSHKIQALLTDEQAE